MCLRENLERKTERIYLENAPNWLIFNYLFLFILIWVASRGIYIKKVTIQLQWPLSGC